MKLLDWTDERIRRMNMRWINIVLLKICVFAFALLLVKLWPPLLCLDWKIYAGIFVITYIPLAYRFFTPRHEA